LGGLGNTASGEASTAMGRSATASGFISTALGQSTSASGFISTAMGLGAVASGDNSTAMGWNATANGNVSTAMGFGTTASGWYSTAMGRNCTANGDCSTATGRQAKALHDGTFVWADNQVADFASTGNNQFCIRASGGVQLNTDTSFFFGSQTRQMLNLYGTAYAIGVQGGTEYFRSDGEFKWYRGGVHSDTLGDPGSGGTTAMSLNTGGLFVNGTFVSASDRNLKENFKPVSAPEVLEKVVALPLSRWNYRDDTASEHLGPMAQDFYAAFGVGPDDKHIATVDESGVALAAIQGLNEKLEARTQRSEDRMRKLESENADLKKELANLKGMVERLAQPRKEH
jgi:hypothetical protein